MRREARLRKRVLRWCLASLVFVPAAVHAAGATKNFAVPQYSLPGNDYKKESPSINQMLRNVYTETQYLQGQISALPTASGTASASTVTVSAPLSGTGASSNPVALTGPINPVNVNLSTVPATGSCTLPNVVTALNAGAAPTCGQPSNVTGNAATATALAAAGTTAQSGYVCRGTDASGNCVTARVDQTVIAASTSPVGGGAVSTALGLKADAFVGLTSACASGFHLSTTTVTNGILTGGSCVADASGGGGGSSTQTVTWVTDYFLSQVNGSQKTFTLSQTPSSSQALMVYLDGLLQSGASDYTYSAPTTITFTTAPAANSSQFQAVYTINTSTIPAAMLVNSTDTVSGAKNFTSSVTVTGAFAAGLSTATAFTGNFSVSGTADTPNCNIVGTTVTMTTPAVPLRFDFNGTALWNGSNLFVGVVLDGDWAAKKLPDYATGDNYESQGGGSNNSQVSIPFWMEIPAVAAGSHWACLHFFNTTAAATLVCANHAAPCQFKMSEKLDNLAP